MPRNPLFLCLAVLTSALLLSGCSANQDFGGWKSSASRPASSPTPTTQQMPSTHAPAPDAPMAAVPQGMETKSKVAILLPLSGRGKDAGEAMLNAAQLAMFDLGASDLFELTPKDTGSGAANAANEALNEGAGLILGPLFSDDTKAVAPLAVQRGVAVVSFSTDTTAAVGTTFLMGFVPQTQVEQIIDYTASRGKTRIALIAPRDAYGDAVAATFYTRMQQRQLTNAGLVRYDAAGMPSSDQLADLKRLPVDAVLIAAGGQRAAQISAALSAQGLTPALVQRLGTGLWDDKATLALPELQGAWYAASSADLRTRFERRYFETYGVTAPRLASLAYDATALAVVLSKTGRGYGRAALTNPNGFSGIDGIFRFRPDGLADRGLEILEIRNNGGIPIQSAPSSFYSMRK
ncbi:MAG TPA: penicillin-binding protein activator [Alphaproteobacteria bacterium]|nr:penicillin-binding protein activator [Alphaproteobacteria bacterium]HNS43647.1 penicillin-binding protein activator [Alphaproteobacteria bacterium]